LLFLDGDHIYAGVRRDYELHAPLVCESRLVAFHDIVDGPEELADDMPHFWCEVRSELDDVRELVKSWGQGGYGIGVARRRLALAAA
jgi:hypothetical protein